MSLCPLSDNQTLANFESDISSLFEPVVITWYETLAVSFYFNNVLLKIAVQLIFLVLYVWYQLSHNLNKSLTVSSFWRSGVQVFWKRRKISRHISHAARVSALLVCHQIPLCSLSSQLNRVLSISRITESWANCSKVVTLNPSSCYILRQTAALVVHMKSCLIGNQNRSFFVSAI